MASLFGNPAAFAPFFRDRVAVEGTRAGRRVAGTFRACVFDQGPDDPFAEDSTSTVRRRYSVVVRKGDWTDVEAPRPGFKVTIEDGTVLSVKSVGSMPGMYVLEARTC